jgi:hypothetical protein
MASHRSLPFPNWTRERIELASREFLFHDLLHYAVESSLGTQEGFWGALASGRSMADLNDRTGAAMAGLSGPMAGIEVMVGMMTGAIKSAAAADPVITIGSYHEALGQEMPAWCTTGFVEEVRERMRQVLGRWKAVRYRGTMEIDWPGDGR